MIKYVLPVLCLLAGAVAGCGATAEPSAPPPTQTPWIIVVTATVNPAREGAPAAEATQTPWIVVATPTRTPKGTTLPTATMPPTATTRPTTSATEEPGGPTTTAAATATRTSRPPTPTKTVEPSSLKYEAPILLEPNDSRSVDWNSTLLFKWTSVGELDEDEYYHLHIERPPPIEGIEWWGDYVFTKDTQYVLNKAFMVPFHLAKEHGAAPAYWWVRVVRKTGEDENGKPIGVDVGLPSERRTLIIEPRP
jgi:hypothetical protein